MAANSSDATPSTSDQSGEEIYFGPYKIRSSEVFFESELSWALVNLKPIVPGENNRFILHTGSFFVTYESCYRIASEALPESALLRSNKAQPVSCVDRMTNDRLSACLRSPYC
jgi:hypothetical protein